MALFALTSVNAQWIRLNSGATENLNSVFCITKNLVFVAGDNGKILKTTNGGMDWSIGNSNTINKINSIFFIDSLVGFSVGDNGTIIKTTDGGDNWQLQISNTSNKLNSVYFINKDIGFIVGMHSTLIKTINGGMDWEVDASFGPCCLYLNSIYFLSENKGRILGYDMPGTIILTTTDTGETWDMWVDPEAESNNWWAGHAMTESSDMVIVAGENGKVQNLLNGMGWWDCMGAPLGNGSDLNSVYAIQNQLNKWYAVGANGTVGFFPNTGNGNQVSGVSSDLNSIYFADSLTGYIAGDSGVILKTTNGGYTITNVLHEDKQIFTVYPNPVNTQLIIETANLIQSSSILTICNINGQELIKQKLTDAKTKIDVSNLTSGIYFIKLFNDKTIKIQKIIKE